MSSELESASGMERPSSPISELSDDPVMMSSTSCESLSDGESLKPVPQEEEAWLAPDRCTIIGSGNWGSAIARIIGHNVVEHEGFEHQVRQWVFPENVEVDGETRSLPDVINERHENVKYLPGVKLPDNIMADPDLASAVQGATILVFVMPHQFLDRVLPTVAKALGLEAGQGGISKAGRGVRAISLIKGVDSGPEGLTLISDKIRAGLGGLVPVSCLMGANVASEVAKDEFCETTVGLADQDYLRCRSLGCLVGANTDARTFFRLFHRPTFRVTVVRGASTTVELCGALKNVVALGAAFCDGLGYGGNTKAAIVRAGLAEMRLFAEKFSQFRSGEEFNPQASARAFLESCGVGDLMTTCYGASRNRRCAEMFAREGGARGWEVLEREELGGMKLQGPSTAEEAFKIIQAQGLHHRFPLISTIYRIAFKGCPASTIVQYDADQSASAFPAPSAQKRKFNVQPQGDQAGSLKQPRAAAVAAAPAAVPL